MTVAPKILDADVAASAIERSLAAKSATKGASATVPPLTIADAAASSGLALRDAERGLYLLTSKYRGHLRVSEDGDLVFLFPTQFTQPWIVKDKLDRALESTWRGVVGAGRFIVRAWVMIVLVAYAAIFLAIVVASLFTRSNDSRSSSFPGGGLLAGFFRVLADAMFWTFHPWSPLAIHGGYYDDRAVRSYGAVRGRAKDDTPFYEKVNRFLFGPEKPKPDERARERAILEEIRAKKGRIGLADVMRVTGLPRHEADPLMARLMLDYDGDVEVSEEGGIFYRFAAIRKTAGDAPTPYGSPGAAPVWSKRAELPPLTGNEVGANLMIAGLNVFNMVMASVALAGHLTLERLPMLFMRHPPPDALLPPTGTAVMLGLVPLAFSFLLFLLPLGRALARPVQARALARENGRRAVLQEVLGRVERKQDVDDRALAAAWQRASGAAPDSKTLTREVVELGGDLEIREDGTTRYRFVDLETEREALEAEREAAGEEEARLGKVVFTSE